MGRALGNTVALANGDANGFKELDHFAAQRRGAYYHQSQVSAEYLMQFFKELSSYVDTEF